VTQGYPRKSCPVHARGVRASPWTRAADTYLQQLTTLRARRIDMRAPYSLAMRGHAADRAICRQGANSLSCSVCCEVTASCGLVAEG
jgi:hypothetical protein